MRTSKTRPTSAPDAIARLDSLAASNTEWAPWLKVVREVIPELSHSRWDKHPPHTTGGTSRSPYLAGATLRPDGSSVADLLERLFSAARTADLAMLVGPVRHGPATPIREALSIFLASINDDDEALDRQATHVGATPEGWRTLAQLLAMPYLHACARRFEASRRTDWSEGYCPVCGAWPAFAEVRGIERTRHLRCGRCGSGWRMPSLTCTYCGTTDHDSLRSLVVDETASRWSVDVCQTCSGYVKSVTTLQPTPQSEILVTDLVSVEFDLAAFERGFVKPMDHGAALHASLEAEGTPTQPAASPRWWS